MSCTNECNDCCGEEIYIDSPLSVGDTLPDFDFEVYQDGKIEWKSLNDYSGKWVVLFFYPADFTFVCPTELEELAENYEKFKDLGAEILSFSTDTAFAHKAWHDSSPAIGKVKYPMGADPTGVIAEMLGVYIEEEGLARRGTFIIDPEGTIKSLEINDNSIGRCGDELHRKLKACKFVNENDGKVCPASWDEGKDTLEPSDELVGKI